MRRRFQKGTEIEQRPAWPSFMGALAELMDGLTLLL